LLLASVAIPQVCASLSTWAVSIFLLSFDYFGKIMFAFLLGSLILKLFIPKYVRTRIWPFLAGVVLYALLVPLLHQGRLIAVVGILFGLGATWMLSTSLEQPEVHSDAQLKTTGENRDLSVVPEG
jgi:predicted branched-subunit amino acid permease